MSTITSNTLMHSIFADNSVSLGNVLNAGHLPAVGCFYSVVVIHLSTG